MEMTNSERKIYVIWLNSSYRILDRHSDSGRSRVTEPRRTIGQTHSKIQKFVNVNKRVNESTMAAVESRDTEMDKRDANKFK
jgi:hypothetical protein